MLHSASQKRRVTGEVGRARPVLAPGKMNPSLSGPANELWATVAVLPGRSTVESAWESLPLRGFPQQPFEVDTGP